MHEEAIINSIIKPIRDLEKLDSIIIEVGELSGIEPEHLKEHLKPKLNCEITTEFMQAKIKCRCSFIGKPKINEVLHDFVVYSCPECHSSFPDVLEGKDIKIKKLVYK
jgi:hydrogenase nickel incorporation protein HypA/HybF